MSLRSEFLQRRATADMHVRSGPTRQAPGSLKGVVSGASLVLGGTLVWLAPLVRTALAEDRFLLADHVDRTMTFTKR